MGEEICRLHVIVEEFRADFHPSPHVLKIYKSVSEALYSWCLRMKHEFVLKLLFLEWLAARAEGSHSVHTVLMAMAPLLR